MTVQKSEYAEASPLDDAARAAWLYYVAGKTQDQIAKELGISRQRAQRLVSRAVADGLIHVRLEHRIARCLDIETALLRKFGLRLARVAPFLGDTADPLPGLAPLAATEMERVLNSPVPIVLALGTGRTLRAAAEELRRMECDQHKIVSLNGNISPDGSASFYDVIMRVADKVRAPHFPMPLPVIASSTEERSVFHSLPPVKRVMELARRADVTFVGIGQMDENVPLNEDGFVTQAELSDMQAAGAVGEIVGWAYDSAGHYLNTGTNLRVAGVRVDPPADNLVVAVAAGGSKVAPLKAALKGSLINGLIADEATAEMLLS